MSLLTAEQKESFIKDGVLVLRNFYDKVAEIEPIQQGIWEILGIFFEKYETHIKQTTFTGKTFDDGFNELIAIDRRYGGQVYDAIKHIPAFMRLCSLEKNEQLFSQLRLGSIPGLASNGNGIRIDNPNEEKFRSLWHYEYRDQLRSMDGIVLWTPLVDMSDELGPVQICPGSHLDGLRRSYAKDPANPEKTGAYALRLENEKEILSQYGIISPILNVGDLVVMDFLTLHSSGYNVSSRSRWSIQMRYFNYAHPSGIAINWATCSSGGNQVKPFKEVHPELIIDN